MATASFLEPNEIFFLTYVDGFYTIMEDKLRKRGLRAVLDYFRLIATNNMEISK